jgi:queuine tRNA-ribosyltransferase
VSIQFEIEGSSGLARIGKLITLHGEVQTPVFMPVGTLASVKAVPQDVLEASGVEILLANTYHLYLRPGIDRVKKLGGLHRFMSWSRGILTDSGGFQVFSLSDLRKVSEEGVTFRSHLDGSSHFLSPENAMKAQIGLGADIIMAFDECTEYPAETSRVRQSMEMTLRWEKRSKRYFEAHKDEVPWGGAHPDAAVREGEPDVMVLDRKSRFLDCGDESASRFISSAWNDTGEGAKKKEHSSELQSGQTRTAVPRYSELSKGALPFFERTQALFGIVQGGMHATLRRESAERTTEIGFDGYAIGGLSVGEPRSLTREIVEATLEHLPADKPRYLMGVGTPEEIIEYSNLGIDMMDCVLPTRAARHGLLFTSEGKISIKQARYADDQGPLDPACRCRVCARYSRAYLRHLYAAGEVLAQVLNTIHNLSFYLDTMGKVRHSIALGSRAPFLSGNSLE